MITNFGYGQPERLILDLYPPSAFAGGVRRLRKNYSGASLRVRRDSDDAEMDIPFLANNEIDAAAITTFVGASNPYLVKVYDQGVTANHVQQPLSSLQLRVYVNMMNGHVAFGRDGIGVVGSRMEFTNPIVSTTSMYTFFAGGNTSYAGEGTVYIHGHSVGGPGSPYLWLYRHGLDWMQTDDAPNRSILPASIRYSVMTEIIDGNNGANTLRHMENGVQVGQYAIPLGKTIDLLFNGRGTPGDGAMQYFVGGEAIIFVDVNLGAAIIDNLNTNVMSKYGF